MVSLASTFFVSKFGLHPKNSRPNPMSFFNLEGTYPGMGPCTRLTPPTSQSWDRPWSLPLMGRPDVRRSVDTAAPAICIRTGTIEVPVPGARCRDVRVPVPPAPVLCCRRGPLCGSSSARASVVRVGHVSPSLNSRLLVLHSQVWLHSTRLRPLNAKGRARPSERERGT